MQQQQQKKNCEEFEGEEKILVSGWQKTVNENMKLTHGSKHNIDDAIMS